MAVIIGDKVECKLCNINFKALTNSHLFRSHQISIVEYKELFPKAKIDSDKTKKIKDANRKLAANTERGLEIRSRNGKANKGSKRTEEWKARRSARYSGEGNPFYGKEHSEDTKIKLSAHFQGVEIEEWEEFKTKDQWKGYRASQWSQEIFKRDDYTCALCNDRGGHLEAHYIIPRSECPEKKFDLDNGVTLCINCHRSTFGKEHTYKGIFGKMVKEKNKTIGEESSKVLKSLS